MSDSTGTYFPRTDGRSDVRIRLEHGVVAGENPLAPWVVVGHCPRCGIPYFVRVTDVSEERPPYVWRSCTCFRTEKETTMVRKSVGSRRTT